MRARTDGAVAGGRDVDAEGEDDVLWLLPRSGREALLSHVLDRLDRAGDRVGRVTVALGFGLLTCAAVSNSALAPVASARAATERFKLHPVFPSVLEQVSEPSAGRIETGEIAASGIPAAAAPPPTALSSIAGPALAARAGEVPHELVGPFSTPIGHQAWLDGSSAEIQFPSIEEGREAAEEYLRFGSRELPRRLVDMIVKAALATDVDPIYLMALADKESSFRTEVRASTSSAVGLFQFIERTWLETIRAFGPKHGLAAEAALVETVDDKPAVADPSERARILDLRRDPYVASLMAAEMLRRDAAEIGLRIGRTLNETEMYLAHFLGLDGAARFIAMRAAKKARSATAAFPAAAKANVAIFFEQGRGRKARRKGLSVPEVYARIDRMIDSRLELFRPVKDFAAGGA